MKGFGIVVTGTLQKGKVQVGDKVEIYPGGKIATVKGIQIHKNKVEKAEHGWRVALNLSGVEKEHVSRPFKTKGKG